MNFVLAAKAEVLANIGQAFAGLPVLNAAEIMAHTSSILSNLFHAVRTAENVYLKVNIFTDANHHSLSVAPLTCWPH